MHEHCASCLPSPKLLATKVQPRFYAPALIGHIFSQNVLQHILKVVDIPVSHRSRQISGIALEERLAFFEERFHSLPWVGRCEVQREGFDAIFGRFFFT